MSKYARTWADTSVDYKKLTRFSQIEEILSTIIGLSLMAAFITMMVMFAGLTYRI